MFNRKKVTELQESPKRIVFRNRVWRMVSVLTASVLLITAGASAVFAQEETTAEVETQEESEGESVSLQGLLSGILSGISEIAENGSDGLKDVLSSISEKVNDGTVSDVISSISEKISDGSLSDLFSSFMGDSSGNSVFSSWVPSYEWTITTEDYGYQLPDDAAKAFETATQALMGKNYVPVALLETQVVAGTNYRILCVGTVVVPDAVPELDVLTIYEDLQGNASVTGVTPLDLNVVYGGAGQDAEETSGNLAGGWAVPEEKIEVKLPEKVLKTVADFNEDREEGNYLPIAILGTTINDDNMFTTAVLCRLTSAEGTTRYEVLFLAEDDEGWVGNIFRAPLNLNRIIEQSEETQQSEDTADAV